MPLRTARRVGVIDEVLAQMEDLVASGEWPVGSRIPPEPELVGHLGVGRNSVREAVRALSHAGVLEARQGDGTYVRSAGGVGGAPGARRPPHGRPARPGAPPRAGA